MTRQAVPQHLQVLENAGLVFHEKRRGRKVLYTLDPRRLEEAQALLERNSAGWDRAIDRLRDMVEERPVRARPIKRT
jgi:DNA-binding transcriptional ArsR family regulator